MSNDLKKIRGQIRQIVKELLPEVLSAELVAAIEKKLTTDLREGLDKIDERQKDIQAYMIRSSAKVEASSKT